MRRFREGGFEFRENPSGFDVYYRGRHLGTIETMCEAGGRYCFALGCDNRKYPRSYRGRVRAATALKEIDALKRRAKKEKWSTSTLIVHAWASKPRGSPE
jgi:hypothetical protein